MHPDEVDDDGYVHLLDHEGGVRRTLPDVADIHNLDTLSSTHTPCTTTTFWRLDGAWVREAVKDEHAWISAKAFRLSVLCWVRWFGYIA
jgi:hypothetical protein